MDGPWRRLDTWPRNFTEGAKGTKQMRHRWERPRKLKDYVEIAEWLNERIPNKRKITESYF